jgi:hypothetical protein
VAFSTGTATNFGDFYTKLRDFLISGIGAGANWTQIAGSTGALTAQNDDVTPGNRIVVRGPGTGGTDQILVGMTPRINTTTDTFNLAITGLTIWNPALTTLTAQINRSRFTHLHLWNQPMQYWFIGNARRFIIIVRVSTVYQIAYGGFVLPYVLPTLWPYPLFVGGCSGNETWRFSQVDASHSAFFDPGLDSAALLFPDVVWRDVENKENSSGGTTDNYNQNNILTHPYRYDREPIRENIDGSYHLEPVSVIVRNPYEAQIARFQGVFRVSGFGNSAESIIQVGGVDHLVVPNVFRTQWDDYCAIALE